MPPPPIKQDTHLSKGLEFKIFYFYDNFYLFINHLGLVCNIQIFVRFSYLCVIQYGPKYTLYNWDLYYGTVIIYVVTGTCNGKGFNREGHKGALLGWVKCSISWVYSWLHKGILIRSAKCDNDTRYYINYTSVIQLKQHAYIFCQYKIF